jgi:hypothetical protein
MPPKWELCPKCKQYSAERDPHTDELACFFSACGYGETTMKKVSQTQDSISFDVYSNPLWHKDFPPQPSIEKCLQALSSIWSQHPRYECARKTDGPLEVVLTSAARAPASLLYSRICEYHCEPDTGIIGWNLDPIHSAQVMEAAKEFPVKPEAFLCIPLVRAKVPLRGVTIGNPYGNSMHDSVLWTDEHSIQDLRREANAINQALTRLAELRARTKHQPQTAK